MVMVQAKAEPTAATPLGLLQAAYHLGNRHVPLEIHTDYLRLGADAVLQTMLEQRGLTVTFEVAPFCPERGAYQTGQPYPWNVSVAFCIATALADIPLETALLGYLHSWGPTLINAAVKLIPLGQTAGQVLLRQLQPHIQQTVQQSLKVTDDNLESSTLGLALASMQHETLYCRLFRS